MLFRGNSNQGTGQPVPFYQKFLIALFAMFASAQTVAISGFGRGQSGLEAGEKVAFALGAGVFVALVISLILYALILRRASRTANLVIFILMMMAASAASYAQMI